MENNYYCTRGFDFTNDYPSNGYNCDWVDHGIHVCHGNTLINPWRDLYRNSSDNVDWSYTV